jgi:hypothetical protein
VDESTQATETGVTPDTETVVTETAEDLSALPDAEVEAVLAEATEAAQAATADPEGFTAEVAAAFEAALSRANAARAELNARTERRNSFAAAQAQAAQLAAQAPVKAVQSVVPRVADIAKPVVPVIPEAEKSVTFSLIVPSDAHNAIAGRSMGTEYGSFSEIGRVLDDRSRGTSGQKGTKSPSRDLMQIRRNDTEFAVTGEDIMRDDAVIQHARDQKRLNGGSLLTSWEKGLLDRAGGRADRVSLTAAAGWCAPSETLYDLCEMESLDGLIDLPEITASRGGIRWTQEPTYAQLDAAASFTILTEAQVIANTPKNCAPITCPPFTDTRLNIAATCITGSFLQLRGYPELVARWVRGQLVVHAHKLNEAIIAALVVRAGAVTPIVLPAGDPVTSAVLSAVELAAEDIRYRNRLSFNQVIEVVLPHWIIPLIRADFTRRAFGDPGLTDARIVEWFVTRKIRPQFVVDWQDGYDAVDGGATFPGGDGTAPFSATLVPAGTAVKFLAFPAGAVVLARQDVITLRNVYDSTNLAQNLYTEMFFEEGWAPIYPCPEIRLYSAQTCPSGATGAMIDLDCTVTP